MFIHRYYMDQQMYQQMYEQLKHNTPPHPHPVADKKKSEPPSQHHLGSYTPDSTTHYNACDTNNQMDMSSNTVNSGEQNYNDSSLFTHYQTFPQLAIPKVITFLR